MRERCYLPSNISYARYGAKGVTVCERWFEFENFLADMGERPAGHVLSRTDDTGDYEPGNVTWKTLEQNSSEKKSARGTNVGLSKLKEADVLNIRALHKDGVGLRELGREFKVCHSTIRAIVKNKTWTHI